MEKKPIDSKDEKDPIVFSEEEKDKWMQSLVEECEEEYKKTFIEGIKKVI